MPEHIGENELITAHVFQDVSETWLYRSCGLSRWQMGILLFSPTLKCPEFKTEAYILKNCSALEWKSSYNFRRDWQTFWIWIKEEEQAARADQECLRARSRKDGHPSLKRERERERTALPSSFVPFGSSVAQMTPAHIGEGVSLFSVRWMLISSSDTLTDTPRNDVPALRVSLSLVKLTMTCGPWHVVSPDSP